MNEPLISIPIDVREFYAPPFFTAIRITFPFDINAADIIPLLTPPIKNPHHADPLGTESTEENTPTPTA